jgi:hypothetical protein
MSFWLKLTFLGVATALSCVLVAVSASSFYLAAGSDSGVEIRTLPLGPKIAALVISTGALLWALFGDRRRRWQRQVFYALSVIILGVATHAVMLNHKRGLLQEHWFSQVIHRASFDVADGIAHDWQARPAIGGVSLQHRRNQETVFVFTGVWPWRLDIGSLLD